MRRGGIVVSAAVLAVLGVAVPCSSPAGAAATSAKHCATKAQYKQVSHGMSIARVAQILGHGGQIYQKENNGGYGFQWRSYHACEARHSIAIRFSKLPKQTWHVTAKDFEHE